MIIFKDEIDAGLKDKILAEKTLSYNSKLERAISLAAERIKMIAVASENNLIMDGLYPVQSILVSTVWNLNDDVFDKYETFIARNTPVNKPTNLNHIESDIVGHMTGSICIDDNGNIIPDDILGDELPDLFHIVNSAVIYQCFSEPEQKNKIANLIKEIDNGEMFVSMEANFKGFDYALMDESGNNYKVIERNAQTAFLTKSLRAYGGSGTYSNYRIGRLLRGITFVGKGYVKRPGNPSSIIFDKDSYITIKSNSNNLKNEDGVFNLITANIGVGKTMSNELETKINELTAANEAFVVQVEELNQKVETLIAEKTSVASELDSNIQEKAKLLAENQTLAQQVVDISNEKFALAEQVKALTEEIEAAKTEKKMMCRKDKLKSAGYTEEDATAKLELFNTLSDEQFDCIIAELSKVKSSKDTKNEDVKNTSGVSNNTEDINNILDNAKAEQVLNIGPVPEETSKAKQRQELSNIFTQLINNKK